MKWCIDYNSQHITEEFWFTLKKKKQIHVCACTYKNPQEDILRFSIMAQSIKAYIFRKHINVFYENTSIAVKSWSTSQIICTMYEGVTLFLRNRF